MIQWALPFGHTLNEIHSWWDLNGFEEGDIEGLLESWEDVVDTLVIGDREGGRVRVEWGMVESDIKRLWEGWSGCWVKEDKGWSWSWSRDWEV